MQLKRREQLRTLKVGSIILAFELILARLQNLHKASLSKQYEKKRLTNHVHPDKCVLPEEKNLTSDYTFLCMEQYFICYATEKDCERLKTMDIEIDYAGLCCRYCKGESIIGVGRYFVTKADVLLKNMNFYCGHISICPLVPNSMMEKISIAKLTHKEQMKDHFRKGSQALFLEHLWERMHEEKCFIIPDKETALARSGSYIVSLSDKCMTTSLVFYSMQQFVLCFSTDDDVLKNGGPSRRSRIPLRCPELMCKHCMKYRHFPRTLHSLREQLRMGCYHNHLLGCKYVSLEIKSMLKKFKEVHDEEMERLGRASLSSFCRQVWKNKLHKEAAYFASV